MCHTLCFQNVCIFPACLPVMILKKLFEIMSLFELAVVGFSVRSSTVCSRDSYHIFVLCCKNHLNVV